MRRRGFTMVEVMVAVVILSIAVLGLVGTQIHAVRSSEGNRHRHLASEIATTLMSGIEARVRQEPAVSAALGRTPVPSRSGYAYEVAERFEDAPGRRLRHVEIKVFYVEEQVEQHYTLWTMIYHE